MVHSKLSMMSRDSSSINITNGAAVNSNNTNVSFLLNATSANSSSKNPIQSYSTAEPVEICFLVVLMIVILFGNGLVCCAFSTVERKLRTVTNYFVISLAVSDILVGSFSMTLWLCIRTGAIKNTRTATSIYTAFDIICGAASILNLTLISVERTIAVIFPAKHRNLSRNRPIIYGGIASVWVIALTLALLFGYALPVLTKSKHLILLLTIIIFVVPTIIIIFSYMTIFYAVKTRENFHHTFKYEVRLAAMIGIVIVLFLLCWFPFFLFNLLAEYCPCWDATFITYIPIIKYLHYSNSTMNPIIYAYRNSDYRRAFKKLLFKFFTCGSLSRYETRSERAMSGRSTLASHAHSAYRETILESEDITVNGNYKRDYEHGLLEVVPHANGIS